MKERPILFSGPMVRAILDGRKTQTRRIVPAPSPSGAVRPAKHQLGDRLWVRETHALMCHHADPHCYCDPPLPFGGKQHYAEYRADVEANIRPGGWPDSDPEAPRWRPSIHMPRWASRITLEVTSARIERLQDISAEDVRAEGLDLDPSERCGCEICARIGNALCTADQSVLIERFWHLWDAINGSRAPWSLNPFVWVVSFRRVS